VAWKEEADKKEESINQAAAKRHVRGETALPYRTKVKGTWRRYRRVQRAISGRRSYRHKHRLENRRRRRTKYQRNLIAPLHGKASA